MGNFRPGRATDAFEDSCLCDAARIVCKTLGDRLLINGNVCCVIFKASFEKKEYEDVSIADEETKIYWPTCDPIPVRVGHEVKRKGVTYEICEQPRDLKSGWTCATLDCCGNC